jgi:probable rRNA maturation factor
MILLDPDLDPDPDPDTKSAALPSARTLSIFLNKARSAVRLKGQVTVLLTTDNAIRTLNRRFRGKNKATDVLSFPAYPLQNTTPAERLAGDMAIGVPTARRQAAEEGHALSIEIKILILHGLLHLAGYDHEADTGQMARREQKLRAKLRLPQGLIERVATEGGGGFNPHKKPMEKTRALAPEASKASRLAKPRVPLVSTLRPGKVRIPSRRSPRP